MGRGTPGSVGDVLAAARDRDGPALVAPGSPDRRYGYDRLVATTYRTANVLRRYGVHAGATVAVTDRRDPEPVLALLGAALLGGVTRVGGVDAPPEDARAIVCHRADDAADPPTGATAVVYGGPPDDPGAAHFEREVWSENPAFPPGATAGGDAVALPGPDAGVTQRTLVAAARAAAAAWSLSTGDRVAVRSSLARPGTVAGGVLAALSAGATVLLPAAGATGDVAVADDPPPESRWTRPAAVLDADANRSQKQ